MIDLAEILTKIKPYVLGWTTGTLSGSANPTAPFVGQTFFRADLGMWVYWNGAYWLTTQEYEAKTARKAYSATTTIPAYNVLRNSGGNLWRPYFTRCHAAAIVATTNEAGKLWSIIFRVANVGYSTFENLFFAYTTDYGGPNVDGVIAKMDVNKVAAIDPVAHIDWYVQKVGTPGNLTVELTTFYRYIIT